jgi:hypothetical protein
MRNNRPDGHEHSAEAPAETADVRDENSRQYTDVLPADVVLLVAKWLRSEYLSRQAS